MSDVGSARSGTKMTLYRFVTFWQVDAPIDAVWDAIVHPERWPEWWPGVLAVEEIEGGEEVSGLGNVQRYTMKSRLPYALKFETRSITIEQPRLLDATATGELEGIGRWRLAERDGGTLVRSRVGCPDYACVDEPVRAPGTADLRDQPPRDLHRGGKGLARLLGVQVRYGRGTPDKGPLASSPVAEPTAD